MTLFSSLLAILIACLAFPTNSYASPPAGLYTENHSQNFVQPAPAGDDSRPVTAIPTDQYQARYTPAIEQYALKVMLIIEKSWSQQSFARRQELFAHTQNEEIPPVANFSIDKTGRLLWVAFDTEPGPYGKSLLDCIVKSAPFPLFTKQLPARIALRAPFAGPDAKALLSPELIEDVKPIKVHWEPNSDKKSQVKTH